jgi:hypothetical protein
MLINSPFDGITRHNLSVGGHTEPSFDYLKRSARPSATAIRALLDDSKHLSALFEPYRFELPARPGCDADIPTPDPGTATEHLPDFFVPTHGDHGVRVEVTLAIDRNPATEGAAGKYFG